MNIDPSYHQYYHKKAYMLAILLLVIGGINWLLVGIFRLNLVEAIFGKGVLARSIYIAVGVAALAVACQRDTYLPFLGETLVPCSVLQDHSPPGATVKIDVDAEPGKKVLYWAAEPETEHLEKINDWRKAYLSYENAGITTADSQGTATLKVRKPQSYRVPWKGQLEPHIHFRVCGERGFLGRVKTVFLSDGHVEGFIN